MAHGNKNNKNDKGPVRVKVDGSYCWVKQSAYRRNKKHQSAKKSAKHLHDEEDVLLDDDLTDLPNNFSDPALCLLTLLTLPFHSLPAAAATMTQEKAKEQAEDEVVDDNAQEAKEQIVDDNAQEAKERADDEVPQNNAQEVEEIFTQGCQDDEYYTDSETGERLRNPFIAGSTWRRQLGYRSEYFAEWKEHFEEMTKLCQEAMDLREERDNLLYGFVDDIRSEQDALFDVLTYREDAGLSKLSQRAQERKERNLSHVEQRQQRTTFVHYKAMKKSLSRTWINNSIPPIPFWKR
ncbi:ABC metal ion transporter [Lasiodiplodia theobromae]|uniref:ABC metal ion transporter n=1 Tax=Lasiodiplodia theobromae TaxID=45133 RepID=UPI0015C36A47|nr:ABC metal ion transporter [Lasiodiplodia theobromae]KAF4541887.1 ABC metal ion transporter [Lasiodiplodia theobromae]